MEEEKNKETMNLSEEVEKQVDKKLETLVKQGIQQTNVDYVYKLIDIKKDLKEMEDKDMMYGNDYYGRGYGTYAGGRSRDSMGRYTEGNYGRRGRYRGEDALDEMRQHYGNYHDTNSYGAKEDSSYRMIDCFKEFGYSIAEELEPKDKQMFKQAMQEVMMALDK